MTPTNYPGNELSLFAGARNWKQYYAAALRPFLRGDVLEVGAGLGESTPYLQSDAVRSWLCLEPDATLARALEAKCATLAHADRTRVQHGTLEDLDAGPLADAILYLDVLEHIEDDRAELERAVARLRPGGALIVLAPAHMALFSPFDRAIGHFRRYNRRMLRALAPAALVERRLFYLDAVGMLCSLANRLVLRASQPTVANLAFWDRWMVPVSRALDPLTGHRLGRSVVAIWQLPATRQPRQPQESPS